LASVKRVKKASRLRLATALDLWGIDRVGSDYSAKTADPSTAVEMTMGSRVSFRKSGEWDD
jgi:hypothetical protein